METIRLIHAWYAKYQRDLPWRQGRNPYHIWLSEVILQQTRVEQGTPYYLKFIESFPSILDLAAASEDTVLKLWQGLGYYSRARNLHQAAKQVAEEYGGVFPENYAAIRKLKGVGDYTAAAVASLAFDLPYAVVDGNVYRVLSRIFGIGDAIDSTTGKRNFQNLANELIENQNPAIHNQALMEFGALQCKPGMPNCDACPVAQYCVAFQSGKVLSLPVKAKKTTVKELYFHYFVIKNRSKGFVLKKRTQKGIWHNLYDFPCIEAGGFLNDASLLESQNWQDIFKENGRVVGVSDVFRHQLTHRLICAKFYEIEIEKPIEDFASENNFILVENLGKYSVPRLIEKYLEND